MAAETSLSGRDDDQIRSANTYMNRGLDNPAFDGSDEPPAGRPGRNQRRMGIVRPVLPTVRSGIGLANEDFEMVNEVLPVPTSGVRSRKTSKTSLASLQNGIMAGRKSLSHLVQLTREVLPNIDNYRDILKSNTRPSLDELHGSSAPNQPTGDVTKPEEVFKVKFGWIEGVLIRNMLSIWGVMLFLRISWVVALAGIWQMLIIIAISTFITLVTALSMSAISTNGEIGGGGTYYVMSRIMGPAWGGSIGIIFAIANAINASLNVVGFCQTLQDMLKQYFNKTIVDGGLNDTRIIGSITMVGVLGLCGLGAKYEAKTQVVLLGILLIALTNFVVGSIIGPKSDLEKARGFAGYKLDVINENWNSGYTVIEGEQQDFFSVFAVFFPAAIGIFAGANISENLKNPNTAIPKGTILAIIITSLSYATIGIICGATMLRETTGNVADLVNSTFLDCAHKNCSYGIYYDYQAMALVSGFGPLNYAGCFAATLSSALASYVSCPKLMQVIADDKLFPEWLMYIFGKGYGKGNEPYLGYAFTFVLALIFVLIAQLDTIALLISDFFLATFALMNFSTFHICLVKPLGWRPTFKYYNMWLSLFTAALCVVAMFLISWPVALITFAIILFFYMFVVYRKPEVNWGSSTQAQTYRNALLSIQQLARVEDHVKNYRPQLLVLCGMPGSRPALIDFAYLISKKNALIVCGHIINTKQTTRERQETINKAHNYLRYNKIKAFYALIDDISLSKGVTALLETVGIGKMRPNILLMGFKDDWRTCDREYLDQYFAAIHTTFDLHVGMAILRVQEGLNFTGILADIDDTMIPDSPPGNLHRSHSYFSEMDDPATPSQVDSPFAVRSEHVPALREANKKKKAKRIFRDSSGAELPAHVVNSVLRFQLKQKEGTIDVWWLYDDGGLTILLPYIISTRSNWASCKLRVFCTPNEQHDLHKEREGMAALLNKFRIDYTDLIVVSDINDPPKETTRTWFNDLIRDFRSEDPSKDSISSVELTAFADKSERHMRLRELLQHHSSSSTLVVMTLPMPRKGAVGALLYMAWLETLTAKMPPFLLVRGNQTSVLTFYS